MRIVVTGREGQVARSLIERARGSDFHIELLGRPELDLGGPPELIVEAVKAAKPDVLISAAAYTQVDKAEGERTIAFAVNEQGPRALARALSV